MRALARLLPLATLPLVAGLPSCDGASEPHGEIAARPRDVFLIVIDTLRADHLGCYGYDRPTSPRIDRLGSEGAVFERVVSASAFTGPSMASIHTGRYPRFHSFGLANGERRLEDAEHVIAERFAEAGYRTGAVVSNPVLPRRFGFAQGFEHFDHRMLQREAVRQAPERTADHTTDAAIAWLATLSPDEPVFMWVHYMDPHGPYTPPEDLRAAFAPDDPGPALAPPPGENVNSGFGHVPWYQAVDDEPRFGEYVGRYDAEIAATDRELGRFLDWLAAHGRYDDAVILLTSDHGEALGENGYYFCHGQAVTTDQSFVPMLLKHPDVAPGTRVAQPVGHVDVYETLARELGLEPPPAFERAIDLRRATEAPAPARARGCQVRSELGVYVEDELLIARFAPGERESASPDDIVGRSVVALSGAAAPDEGGRDALDALARGYLSQAPGTRAEVVVDEEMEDAMRALGYTGD